MSYNPLNPNGQAIMNNSAPVVIASDQSAVPVTDNGGSLTVDGTVTANISGSIANTSFEATQGTATNLKTQAECFQGGSAVSSSNPLNVAMAAGISGGSTAVSNAVTNSLIQIKAGQSQLYGWYLFNNTSAVIYLQVFNNTSAGAVLGSPDYVLPIPAFSAANALGLGINHDLGITIAATTARNNTVAPASPIDCTLFYK